MFKKFSIIFLIISAIIGLLFLGSFVFAQDWGSWSLWLLDGDIKTFSGTDNLDMEAGSITTTDLTVERVFYLEGNVSSAGLAIDADGDTIIKSYTDDVISFDIGDVGTGEYLFSGTGLDMNDNDLTTIGDLNLADESYLYFDTAKTYGIRYGTAHGSLVFPSDYAVEGSLDIYANSGADGLGNWEPYLALSDTGSIAVGNSSQGATTDRYFYVEMEAGLRLKTTDQSAYIKADNITASHKTFQHPNISGTYVTTNGALANIDIGAYSFEADTITDGVATLSGGNITGMGNITGDDVDISAGTGTFITTDTGRFDSGLLDSSNVLSVEPNNRILTDQNGDFAVDFTNNRFLARANMSHSLDWETGQWIASDGSVQGDYNTAGTLDFQDNAITTTGTITSGDITIFDATPILVFQDSNSAGATSVGFIEWKDSGGGRAGFFGNNSSGNDDLYWKNEQGGNIGIETTGAGNLNIIATLAQFNATPITTTGLLTAGSPTQSGVHMLEGDTFPTVRIQRNTATTQNIGAIFTTNLKTSGNMASGHGPTISFEVQDDTAGPNIIASIGAFRRTNDTSGRLIFNTYNSGASSTKFYIEPDGDSWFPIDGQTTSWGAGTDLTLSSDGTNGVIATPAKLILPDTIDVGVASGSETLITIKSDTTKSGEIIHDGTNFWFRGNVVGNQGLRFGRAGAAAVVSDYIFNMNPHIADEGWHFSTDGTDVMLLKHTGELFTKNKVIFTQTDGNEYIDSLNTGYMDYGATIAHRFNTPVRGATSLWWRVQHIDLASVPALGAVGATYTPQSANNLNGYQLDNAPAEEYLNFNTHVGTDWDESSDLEVFIQFETNVDNSGGLVTDTVNFDLVMYYKGDGETAQKTQDLDASVVVGQAAQYYHEEVMFTIDYDLANNVVQIGDCVSFALHLNTTDSEVDNVIVHHAMFRYKTNKVRAEI